MRANIILVGCDVKVSSGDASWEGRVVDESRNTISLLTKDGVKVLEKQRIKVIIGGEAIDGGDLVGRIEERIKRSMR